MCLGKIGIFVHGWFVEEGVVVVQVFNCFDDPSEPFGERGHGEEASCLVQSVYRPEFESLSLGGAADELARFDEPRADIFHALKHPLVAHTVCHCIARAINAEDVRIKSSEQVCIVFAFALLYPIFENLLDVRARDPREPQGQRGWRYAEKFHIELSLFL